MTNLVMKLATRWKSGTWSRFSLGLLLWHIVIWSSVLTFELRGESPSNVTSHFFAWFVYVTCCECLVQVCRTLKELLLSLALMHAVGVLYWPLMLLPHGSYAFPIAAISWHGVQLGFVGITLLAAALAAPYSVLSIQSSGDVSNFSSLGRTVILHAVTWVGVTIYERAAGFEVRDLRVLVVFPVMEPMAILCHSFDRLLWTTFSLHVVIIAQALIGEVLVGDVTGENWNYWELSVDYWLWPELTLSGWILLIWMLSPPEKFEIPPEEHSP